MTSTDVIIVTDQQVQALCDYPSLIDAMDGVFLATARQEVDNFPFVRSRLRGRDALFGIKSGANYLSGALGLKCGGYWEDNARNGLDRHQSIVLLLHAETGRPKALVAGNNLTALRTAAAAAAAARRLARPGARNVAILGTGRQALFQLRALCEVRPIRSVAAWSRSEAGVAAFGPQVAALGLEFRASPTPADATRDADIVVTVTPSTEPLIQLGDIRPGAHINAMGSDSGGKRELSADLMGAARVWADDVEQAAAIGECQHLPTLGGVAAFGRALIDGVAHDESEITVFDGTGLALQDLAAASQVIETAERLGVAQSIAF